MDRSEPEILKLAFQAALASRRETFLARYPRNLKLLFVALPLVVLVFFFSLSENVRPSGIPWGAAPESHSLLSEAASSTVLTQEPNHLPLPIKTPEIHAPSSESEREAILRNDDYESKAGMIPAPEPVVTEQKSYGELPIISRDGRRPWEIYARPFDRFDPRPRIALVIVDLGLSRIATDAALHRMPGPVTMAFDAQGSSIRDWMARARLDGHETILALPMEPLDYPRNDPGPNTLLVSLPNSDNIGRFLKFLGAGTGYVGVTSLSGSRFLGDPQKLDPILDIVRDRGLIILDAEVSPRSGLSSMSKEKTIPYAVSSLVADEIPSPQAIDEALDRAEKTAKFRGSAVVLASPLPLTLERLKPWINGLSERGVALAPLSAVVVH